MAGQLTIDTLRASTGPLAAQNGMTGICKAWLNYNGATQTVRDSFNVSSVTYNGTADYTINFATVMSNANYAVCGTTGSSTGSGLVAGLVQTNMNAAEASVPPTTSALRFRTVNATYSNISSPAYISITVFGT
jgi:hypothetical protein